MYTMPKDISIKELRTKLADYADRVERGETFRVIRRSKPSFMIMKIDEEMPGSGEEWETIVDFTEKGKIEGAPIEEILKTLKKMRR